MRVLTINSGSATVKFKLFDGDRAVAAGIAERIGEAEGALRLACGDARRVEAALLPDHAAALRAVFDALAASGELARPDDLAAVGHRIVHGGERFAAPVRVDDGVLAQIRALEPLAPLHNPAGVLGIEVARRLAPGVPQVAVFDTAFHQRMPAHAYLYALPHDLYREHGIRRYGFHGTSHGYVAARAAERLGKPVTDLKLITLHLGNGASAAAIDGGRSIDTSMGMTPLEGLVMGSRCGDLDPAIPGYLAQATGRTPAQVDRLLNRDSGLLGLCGENDMRAVHARIAAGDPHAATALDLFCYRIRKYIGAYLAALGGADAVVFTGGIGENDAAVRERACSGLEALGIALDPARNRSLAGEGAIHADRGRVRLLVVQTDEERAIARAALATISTRTRGDES